MTQSVVPPVGFTGFSPVVGVDLYGPPANIASTSLPVSLDLNDWPDATIYFVDLLDLLSGFKEPVASYVAAEIHTLTPVDLPPVPGDYNANGAVDAADYVVWSGNFGLPSGARSSQGDGNGDGDVDGGDFLIWQRNFGQTAGSGAGVNAHAAVPEPATLVLLMFVATGLRARRGRAAWFKCQKLMSA